MSTTASQVRAKQKGLCRICAMIDFDRYLVEDIEVPFRLGSWETISRRQECPFCRLILRSMQSDTPNTHRQTNEEIVLRNELSWKLGIELSPYDRSRSESYSNKYDLRSMAIQCSRAAYRFLVCFRDDVQESCADQQKKRGMIQYLAHREKNPTNRKFFGRKVDRENIDLNLLRSWLSTCSKWHNGECEGGMSGRADALESLRLIDTRYSQIRKFTNGKIPSYVALSYMWGTEEMKKETGKVPAKLLRKNIKWDFGSEKTPLDPNILPKTIQDAICLTKSLGYRYLWADALCIIQDASEQEKNLDLKDMKLIYSYASLTIAAAAGTHADYGIPGVGVPRKFSQYSELVNGLRLATMFPSFTAVENSSALLWNTRGWTFQEKVLSKRILIFTDFQVYFRCAESVWTEEIAMETERLSKSAEARPAKYSWQPGRQHHLPEDVATDIKSWNPRLKIEDDWNYLGGFLDYAAAVQEFSKRSLTNPKDTLFAIGGVLETMKNVVGHFTLGLPRKHFLESLLWCPDVGCVQLHNSGLKLPSWTWASSHFERGGVSFDLMDVRQLRSLLLVSMQVFHDDDDNSNADGLFSQLPTEPYLKIWMKGSRVMTLRKTYGNMLACLEGALLQKDHTINQIYYRNDHKLEAIDFNLPINTLNLPGPHPSNLIPAVIRLVEAYAESNALDWKPNIRPLAARDYHGLIFKTVIVKFRIGKALCPRATTEEDEVGIFELKNSHGETVGEITATYRTVAGRDSRTDRDFLTVSWGLCLRRANVHDRWLPRWKHDGEGNEQDEHTTKEEWEKISSKEKARKSTEEIRKAVVKKLLRSETGLIALVEPYITKIDRYVPGRWLSSMSGTKEGPATKLFHQLYFAKQGEPIPRDLWAVVNLILVEWKQGRARRLGVGKVIMDAWQEQWAEPQEVEFV